MAQRLQQERIGLTTACTATVYRNISRARQELLLRALLRPKFYHALSPLPLSGK